MQTNTPSTLFQLAIVCLHYRVHTGLGFLYLGFCSSKICASPPLSSPTFLKRVDTDSRTTDLGTFIATCNARDPHGSLCFDETVNTCRLKGLGPSKLPPVHVAIQQERRVDGDDDDDDVVSASTAIEESRTAAAVAAAGGDGKLGAVKEQPPPPPRARVDDGVHSGFGGC